MFYADCQGLILISVAKFGTELQGGAARRNEEFRRVGHRLDGLAAASSCFPAACQLLGEDVELLRHSGIDSVGEVELAAAVKPVRRNGRPICQRQRDIRACQQHIGSAGQTVRPGEYQICSRQAEAGDVWGRFDG